MKTHLILDVEETFAESADGEEAISLLRAQWKGKHEATIRRREHSIGGLISWRTAGMDTAPNHVIVLSCDFFLGEVYGPRVAFARDSSVGLRALVRRWRNSLPESRPSKLVLILRDLDSALLQFQRLQDAQSQKVSKRLC